MNPKVISTLVSMAVVSFMFFLVALFRVEPLHAQTLVFNTVAIEDGALKPLSLNVSSKLQTNIHITAVSATSTAHTTPVKEKNTANVKDKNNLKASTTDDDEMSISSTTDLDTYTRTITADDNNVSNVVVKDDSVAVSYKEPARIFGIIPTEVTVTALVNNDGTVTIKYPWYAFLSGKNAGELKPGLQLHIGQILRTSTTTYAASTTEGTTTEIATEPQVRAMIIHALQIALRDLRVNATTTASTTVNAY